MLIFSGRFAAALARVAKANGARVALSPGVLSLVASGLQVHVFQGDAGALESDARTLPDGWLEKVAKLAGGVRGQAALTCGPRERGLSVRATGPAGEAGGRLQAFCSPYDRAAWLAPDASVARSAATGADAFKAGGPIARALKCADRKNPRFAGVWLGDFTEASEGHRLAHEPSPELAPLRGVWLPFDAATALLALVAGEGVERLCWRWCGERVMVEFQAGASHVYLCTDTVPESAWAQGKVTHLEGEPVLTFQVDVDALDSLLAPLRADGRVCVHTDGAIVAWGQGGAGTDHDGPTVGAPLWSAAVAHLRPILAAAQRAKLARLPVAIRTSLGPATWGDGLVMPVSDGAKENPGPQPVPAELLAQLGLTQAPALALPAVAAVAA